MSMIFDMSQFNFARPRRPEERRPIGELSRSGEGGLAASPADPRDPPVKEDSESVRKAKTAQRVERFAVIWREARKSPKDGLHMLRAVYGPDADQILQMWDLICDIHGPATCSRILDEETEYDS